MYETGLEEIMARDLCEHPELATTIAQVLARLRRGNYYEQELVDAIFQKWRWPCTFADAFAFTKVYSELVNNGNPMLRMVRIRVGATPCSDKARDENNRRLKGLSPQFSAQFWGGCGDHDGWFGWHDHLHLCGNVNVDGALVEGPTVTVSAHKLPLEVGTQSAAKTLHMVMRNFGVARWPYGSDDVWVICNVRLLPRASATCVPDSDGWPCARTQSCDHPEWWEPDDDGGTDDGGTDDGADSVDADVGANAPSGVTLLIPSTPSAARKIPLPPISTPAIGRATKRTFFTMKTFHDEMRRRLAKRAKRK